MCKVEVHAFQETQDFKVTKNDENCFQLITKPLAEMNTGEEHGLRRNVKGT